MTAFNITDFRKTLAKKYWRSVLWIDDEIRPSITESLRRIEYDGFFLPHANEFINEGILCQLKGFTAPSRGEDDFGANSVTEVQNCIQLAKHADILILDWKLGTDTDHSSAIINALLTDTGSRFVIILSQEPDLLAQFNRQFSDGFDESGAWFISKTGGLHILLLEKSGFRATGQVKALINKIYEQLAKVYPDYLHWTAIEIAGRIKSKTHTWLANLPLKTDLAVLGEVCHSRGENIGEAIIENLLEDLKESIDYSSIESTSTNGLNPKNWQERAEYLRSINLEMSAKTDVITDQSEKQKALTTITKIKNVHPLFAQNPLNGEKTDNKLLKHVLSNTLELNSVTSFKESINLLGCFSEIISKPVASNSTIRRGMLLYSAEETPPTKILACISQSCDCARLDNLLFLRGFLASSDDQNQSNPGATYVQLREEKYIFTAKPESLKSLPINPTTKLPDGYKPISVLREVTVNRLSARFWSHTTRMGINQPNLVRDARLET